MDSSVLVFCVTVRTETGESLGPIWVKADSPNEAIALARSNNLIEDGEVASAALAEGEAARIDFGSDVIAVGELPKS